MKYAFVLGVAGSIALGAGSPAAGQLLAAKDGLITFSHVGLNLTSVEPHQRFWTMIGGVPVNPFGTGVMMQFPNIFVSLRPQTPTGGPNQMSVDHIGLQVPSVR